MRPLFEPTLLNRIVMASMTRSRAPHKMPNGLMPADSETFYTPGEKGYTDY